MNPVITINIALLPVLVFGLAVGLGRIEAGAWLGAAMALLTVLWQQRRGPVPALALSILATLSAIALAGAAGLDFSARAAVALGFLGLAIGTAASVIVKRPWTAAYSRAQYQGADQDPLFLRINTVLSAMWSAIFFGLALARFYAAGPLASGLPVVAGIAISVFLPRLWVRRSLQQRIDQQAGYRWPAPDFSVQRSGVDFDVIVIGAGIGGLSAGALLAQAGLRVLVAEQHLVPGGFAHNWNWTGQDGQARPAFRFDSGVHDVSGVWDGGPVHGILARLGLGDAIEWKPLQHRFLTDGDIFDVPSGWAAYVNAMAERFPANASGLRAALADIHAIYTGMYSQASTHSGVPGAPRSVEGMLEFARLHPLTVRWIDKPFTALLDQHITGKAARHALISLAGYISHTPELLRVADMVPLFGYYIHGGCYPVGGSGRLAQALADAIALDGGEVRLETPVAQVLIEGGAAAGVRLSSGQTLRASAVVMNADFLSAVNRLVDKSLWPQAFMSKIDAMQPACSAFGIHLGVRGDFAGVPPVIHIKAGQNGAGIVIPSAVDRTAAPDGYSTVEVMCLLDMDQAGTWFEDEQRTNNEAQRSSPSYAAKKHAAGEQLLRIAELALPGLSARIVCRTEASPLTFRRYDWSSAGAIYGTSGGAIASKSPIPGLVFAGAATHGAGIEAVIISGACAAEALVPGLLRTPADVKSPLI